MVSSRTVRKNTVIALTDIHVKQAKPREKLYALRDGTGLYLEVNAAGKYWRWDYRYQGKRKTVAYGVYPAVSLTQARARHQTVQGVLEVSTDPMALKKAKKHADQQLQETSFKAIAHEWYQSQVSGWSPFPVWVLNMPLFKSTG